MSTLTLPRGPEPAEELPGEPHRAAEAEVQMPREPDVTCSLDPQRAYHPSPVQSRADRVSQHHGVPPGGDHHRGHVDSVEVRLDRRPRVVVFPRGEAPTGSDDSLVPVPDVADLLNRRERLFELAAPRHLSVDVLEVSEQLLPVESAGGLIEAAGAPGEIDRRAHRRHPSQVRVVRHGSRAKGEVPSERVSQEIHRAEAGHVRMGQQGVQVVGQPRVVEVMSTAVGTPEVDPQGGEVLGLGGRRRVDTVRCGRVTSEAVNDDGQAFVLGAGAKTTGDRHFPVAGVGNASDEMARRRRPWRSEPAEQVRCDGPHVATDHGAANVRGLRGGDKVLQPSRGSLVGRPPFVSPATLACAALWLGACGSPEETPGEITPAGPVDLAAASSRRVEVATIQPTSATIQLRLPGEVEGWRDATLAAPAGGYIERVQVRNGDEVRAGQLLISVDGATHQARLAQTEVELQASQRELDRARTLGEAIAAAQRDSAETRHAAAVAAQRSASLAASRARVRAPFAGQVADIDAEVGEVASPGQPLLRLVMVEKVKVTIAVPDRDVVALSLGMPAQVSTEASAGIFEGRISHINPAADLETRSFEVEIEVDNAERRLLPGMIATVQVREEVASGQLVVPQNWIVTRSDSLGVFVEDDSVARWRPVSLGRVVGNQVVVEEGLDPGEVVVVTGHRELVDEELVLVVRRGLCCTDGRVTF